VQFGDNMFHTNMLTANAPAGTESVRVTASALNMVANVNPQQSAAYDNFSLAAASAPSTELLTNGRLNEPAITPGWTTIEPVGLDNLTFATGTFANHTLGGLAGVWFRSFIGGDATLTQSVPGVAGGSYEFSAWSKWEANFPGGLPDTGTETMLELAFLDGSESPIGTPEILDLRTVQTNDNTWREFFVAGIAPAGTELVRISAIVTGMPGTGGSSLAAVFDDFSLTLSSAGLPGDYNSDGVVDAADYTVWRNNFGAADESSLNGNGDGLNGVDIGDYNHWKANYGPMAGAAATAALVPEPTGWMLVMSAMLVNCLMGRRGGFQVSGD
jgi:hypothetical protein